MLLNTFFYAVVTGVTIALFITITWRFLGWVERSFGLPMVPASGFEAWGSPTHIAPYVAESSAYLQQHGKANPQREPGTPHGTGTYAGGSGRFQASNHPGLERYLRIRNANGRFWIPVLQSSENDLGFCWRYYQRSNGLIAGSFRDFLDTAQRIGQCVAVAVKNSDYQSIHYIYSDCEFITWILVCCYAYRHLPEHNTGTVGLIASLPCKDIESVLDKASPIAARLRELSDNIEVQTERDFLEFLRQAMNKFAGATENMTAIIAVSQWMSSEKRREPFISHFETLLA